MSAAKVITSILAPMSMIAGTIALIGIVVGLYFQVLPESNTVIRYAEISFFSLCIPMLVWESWQHLKSISFKAVHLKIFLGLMAGGLATLVYFAHLNGGILTIELLMVIILTVLIVIIMVLGAEPIQRAISRLFPNRDPNPQ